MLSVLCSSQHAPGACLYLSFILLTDLSPQTREDTFGLQWTNSSAWSCFCPDVTVNSEGILHGDG